MKKTSVEAMKDALPDLSYASSSLVPSLLTSSIRGSTMHSLKYSSAAESQWTTNLLHDTLPYNHWVGGDRCALAASHL